MKSTAGAAAGMVLGLAVMLQAQSAEAQSKENFERNNRQKSGFFSRLFSSDPPARTKGDLANARTQKSRQQPDYRKHMDRQRLAAEAIWKQQSRFREEQRKKQLNRKPTAWELAYLKQEKQNRKELRKIMRERDQRLADRARSKKKAMAAMVRYNKKKAKQQPADRNSYGTAQTAPTRPADAGIANRRR